MSANFTRVLRQINRDILLGHAIKALQSATGVMATRSEDDEDEILLAIAGQSLRFRCEVQPKVARTSEISDIANRTVRAQSQLLVTNFMSHTLAAECRARAVQFIDCAGNAYLHPSRLPGAYVFVSGLKPPDEIVLAPQESISTPSALRLIFALLSEPDLLNQPYRLMSEVSSVSMGGVSSAMKALVARGFVVETSAGRVFENKSKLIGEWVAGYTGRLRPKLQSMRFAIPNFAQLGASDLDGQTAAWGGEMAASRMLPYLKPGSVTIYADLSNTDFVSRLVKKYQLRRDPQGAIELFQPFWDLRRLKGPEHTVPLLLVYADLLLSGDSRNLEVSRLILDLIVNGDA